MFPLGNPQKRQILDCVPESIIDNQLNLLCICSDNLSFFGAYLQNGCIAVIHHFAILCNALSNPKVRIISLHLMHPLISEYHPGQSPQPFE